MDPCRATSGTYIVGSLLFFAYWIDPEPKKIYTYVSVAFSLLFFADRVPSVPFFRAGSAFGTGFPRFQPAIRKPRPLFIGKNPKKIKNEHRPIAGPIFVFLFHAFLNARCCFSSQSWIFAKMSMKSAVIISPFTTLNGKMAVTTSSSASGPLKAGKFMNMT